MITFSIQATKTKNFLGTHKPNNLGNCWHDDIEQALVLTIKQAREIVKNWNGYLDIIISAKADPISDAQFKQELYCIKGGYWNDFEKEELNDE